jgi:hypothetical protein
MRTALLMMLTLAVATTALGQPPVGDRSGAVQRAQMRAGAAYRELEQARYELKLAEQDYVNTRDAYRAAPPPAADIKRELDKTKKARDAAKRREARASKAYEAALDEVEKAWGRPPKNQ